MNEPIVYRRGEEKDLDRIVEFQRSMARETEEIDLDVETCTRGVSAVFEDPSLGTYYVAEMDGIVVGSLMLTYEWSVWRAGTIWWIQSVYVVPDSRRRGIYSGLYRHIQDLARSNGDVKGIRLYVDRSNSSAQKVYRRLGMDGDHYLVFEWMKE